MTNSNRRDLRVARRELGALAARGLDGVARRDQHRATEDATRARGDLRIRSVPAVQTRGVNAFRSGTERMISPTARMGRLCRDRLLQRSLGSTRRRLIYLNSMSIAASSV